MESIEKYGFMEDEIYPLTIIKDRYMGSYSGGKYTAWNLHAEEVPIDINCDDVSCFSFWWTDEADKYIIGKGDTVSEALADLYIKLKGGANG